MGVAFGRARRPSRLAGGDPRPPAARGTTGPERAGNRGVRARSPAGPTARSPPLLQQVRLGSSEPTVAAP